MVNDAENGPFQYSANTSGAALIGPTQRNGRAGTLDGTRSFGGFISLPALRWRKRLTRDFDLLDR